MPMKNMAPQVVMGLLSLRAGVLEFVLNKLDLPVKKMAGKFCALQMKEGFYVK